MNHADIPLLTRVATLYYREGLTQQETARRVGVSRQTIGRLLNQAQQLGIVRIEIRSPIAEEEDLARRLEARFGLLEAVVAAADAPSEAGAKEAVGRSGAALVERRLRPGSVLGLGWSTTVLEVVKHLGTVEASEVRIVQLDGGVPQGRYPNQAADIVHRAVMALDAPAVSLMAPLYVDTPEIRASLMGDSQIQRALELGARADLAVFGVGAVSRRSNLYGTGYLGDELIDALLAEGAVGEILGRFYRADGEPCGEDLALRTMGLDLDTLRGLPMTCAVAVGSTKVAAILGALAGGYCNMLVTDRHTAVTLLDAGEASEVLLAAVDG